MSKSALPALSKIAEKTFDGALAAREVARERITTSFGHDLPCVTILLEEVTDLQRTNGDRIFTVYQPSATENVPGIVIDAFDGARLTVNRAYEKNGGPVASGFAIHKKGSVQTYSLGDDPEAVENEMLVSLAKWFSEHCPVDDKSRFIDAISNAAAAMEPLRTPVAAQVTESAPNAAAK